MAPEGMPDVITQGQRREPRPWRGRLAAIAVFAALVTVAAVEHLGHGRAAAPHSRQGATARPPPLEAGAPVTGLPQVPDGIIGQPPLRDRSFRLPVAGQRPTWFWPATGRTAPIRGLPPDGSGYVFARAGGGWAVQPNAGPQGRCGDCAGPARPVYFVADQAGSATRVGAAQQVAPAAATGALWLNSYPPGADMSTTAGTAGEVSAAGAPLRPRLTLPAGYVISRETARGLLLAPVLQRPGAAAGTLWNPAAAATGRTFTGVIAASADAIAWTPPCAPRCQVDVLDLLTGRMTVIRIPGGSSVASGAFSPDGRYLALQVSFGPGGPGVAGGPGGGSGALAMQLDVAATGSGRLTVVPGTWVSSDALVGFGWPAEMDSLIAELSFPAKVQIVAWRPGAARLSVAVVTPAQRSAALIVG
jgi:hypothetical protein